MSRSPRPSHGDPSSAIRKGHGRDGEDWGTGHRRSQIRPPSRSRPTSLPPPSEMKIEPEGERAIWRVVPPTLIRFSPAMSPEPRRCHYPSGIIAVTTGEVLDGGTARRNLRLLLGEGSPP